MRLPRTCLPCSGPHLGPGCVSVGWAGGGGRGTAQLCYWSRKWQPRVIWESMWAAHSAPHWFLLPRTRLAFNGWSASGSRGRRAGATSPLFPHLIQSEEALVLVSLGAIRAKQRGSRLQWRL